jgi:hypothetical protein
MSKFTYEVKTVKRDRPGKARVFVWNTADPDIELPEPTIRGEFPEVDKAYDRFNRAKVRIMKAHLAAAMEADLLPSGDRVKPRFSKKAGCSCPCSPGFILDGTFGFVDYHVTVHEVKKVESPRPVPAAYRKLAALEN